MTDPQSNTALHEQRDWLRVTLSSIGDAVITTDAEGRVTFLNTVAESLTGWTQGDAAGQPLEAVFRIVNQETRHTVENPAARALREGAVVSLANHTLLIRKDGSERAIEDSAAPIRDASGGVIGVVLVFHDITERRRIERAAQDALEYAENVVETVREPMLVLDGQLRVRTANRSFYRTFGVVEGETEGRLLYDLGNRQWDIPALRKLIEEILPQQSSFNDYEVAHDFEGIGRRVMVLNARRVQRDHHDTGLILLAIEDITERRRLEDERQELETRFTSLVKNIRDHSIFTLDRQGHVTSWNREAEKVLGYAEAEAIGQHLSIIFTPEERQAGVPGQELAKALSEGRAEDERWHMRKNGEKFWALGIVTPTYDATGTHTGYSKILRDMTDRKQAEEALRLADRRKDEFLAMLSHELRNPLAPIANAVQLLRLQPNEDQIQNQARGIIERQVGQLTRLVDDLLEVSRITTGQIHLHQERIALNGVVEQAVETVRPLIEQRRHALKVSVATEPIWLYADATRLQQVIVNLLNNAAKYTDQQGHIWVSLRQEGDEAVLTVRDSGVGIAPDLLPRIFDLFTQADRSLDRSQGGLGVGLSLVQRLVEMHRGRVEARSSLGHGSEFVVRLPVLPTPATSPSPSARKAMATGPSLRVLVVDDNVDAAQVVGMLLTAAGHDVRKAHDGLASVDAALEYRPDVVLLDIGLPGMNGLEVAKRLRQQPELGSVVLVAMTGYGLESDRQRSQEAGFDHHLVKPSDFAKLQEILATVRTK